MNLHVTEQEITELLQALVQFPTINPPADTRACARMIVEKLKNEGIETEIVEGKPGIANVVGRMRGSEKGKRLLLNAHMDVVAPGENWTVDPFAGLIRDGHIYGRGSCDMKSGVAAMLMALISFQRSGVMSKGEIVFHVVGYEETGNIWGTRHLIEQGFGADADIWGFLHIPSKRFNPDLRRYRLIPGLAPELPVQDRWAQVDPRTQIFRGS